LFLKLGISVDNKWHFWPGANHAHIAPKYVDKLWQLINATHAQNPSDSCDPRINIPDGRVVIWVGISAHRAELEDPKTLTMCPNPILDKQDRARGIQADAHSRDDPKGARHNHRGGRDYDVSKSLAAVIERDRSRWARTQYWDRA
jgi:hypothetical protein